jgi:hypothetical protein
MRIEIDDPEMIDDLLGFLKGCQCNAVAVRRQSIDALPAAVAINPRLAVLQLEGFLRAWQAMHPGVRVRVN